MTIDLSQLTEPFPAEAVSWRVGSTNADKTKGMALAYIDSRDVQNRLDDVCGAGNWQVRFPWSDGKALCCEIGIRCWVETEPGKFVPEWVWKGDGAGATDVEADKGRFSDAFKRAAVHWRIGRYLYGLDSPWVALEPAGRSYKIAASEMPRLRALLNKGRPPANRAASPASAPTVGAYKVTGLSKEAGAPGFATAMDTLLRKAKSGAELDAILADNREAMERLAGAFPDLRADILKTFEQAWSRFDPALMP